MALKDFLSSKKGEAEELYWALVVEPGWIQAGVWQLSGEKVKVISIGPPTAWELEEELVEVVDTALSSAIQSLPKDAPEPSKTVFGLASSWVSKAQIKDKYLAKLKLICTKLSLDPTGFVVLPEAIAHLIKSEETVPLNAALLGISKENIELSVFKLGKLVGISYVARSVSIVDDVVEGLTRFASEDSLPSRFLLYDGKEGELEEVKQALLGANWSEFEKIKLLHTPRIETVLSDRKVLAVSLAGASEANDVSFVEIADQRKVARKESEEDKQASAAHMQAEEVKPEDLGFAVGRDVLSIPAQQAVSSEKPAKKDKGQKEGAVKSKYALSFNILRKARDAFSSPFKGKSMRLNFGQTFGKKAPLFAAVSLFLILLAGLYFWWFYPKAEVTVYVSPKKLEEKIEVTVDPEAAGVDLAGVILPGRVLRTDVSSEKTKSTTGAKTVGEKAKGELELFRVGSELTLPAGTAMLGPGDLRFSLDENISIASGSAGTPGKAKAAVTAVGIGAQYNLSSGASFAVGNYSKDDIEARNEAVFSGGTSREISAVAGFDQKTLEEELTEELLAAAERQLVEGLAEQEFFIKAAMSATPSAKAFSAKIGDEASNLKLSLSLDIVGLSVDKATLADLAKEILADKVPEGFVLREDQIDVGFTFKEKRGRNFLFSTNFVANFLPEIKGEEVAKKIAGRYPPLVEEFLTSIPGFIRAEIRLKPRLPGRLGTLPRVVKNIDVEVTAEK